MAGVYGLSGSGMDVDSLVKGLMKAQRIKYDTLQQKKMQLEWKKTDYNAMYTAINDFRTNTVFNNKLQGTLMPKSITSSDETKVAVTANADAANISHTMTVAQLADGVKKTSSANITTGAAKDTLLTQFVGLDTTAPMTIKITNGSANSTITVDPSKSINELVSSINNAGVNVKANYDATLDRFMMYSTNTGSSAEINFTGSSTSGSALLGKLNINASTEKGKDAEFALDGVGTG
ncbi:MAG: flagellar hook protein FliD, partial [Sporomusaceae bacterium]|nr:flagellar hook protein FliD [Sporomusaceae bacterium]